MLLFNYATIQLPGAANQSWLITDQSLLVNEAKIWKLLHYKDSLVVLLQLITAFYNSMN